MSSSVDAAMRDAPESAAAESPLEEGAAECSEYPLEEGAAECSESPLEEGAAECSEHAPQQLHQDQTVKHKFIHVRLKASWLGHYLHIDVNHTLQVSVNGGAWHGQADFYVDGEGCNCWNLTFNWQAHEDQMKTILYMQIEKTDTYLHIESQKNNEYNCMLIVKHD